MALCCVVQARAADEFDSARMAEQAPAGAVDALNFQFSALAGGFDRNVLGTASNIMFNASIATPVPLFERFGAQVDLAAGSYDGDYTSAATGLHLFWRDPAFGAIGIYGDWVYVNPEHAGRIGAELSFYSGRWSVDALVGVQFGQHVYTEFIDEVDFSYYFTDNTRGSIGHRLTSRGHVANLSFEHLLVDSGFDGWSLFGEIEGGEDNYVGGYGGIRYSFGSTATTLIDRDRQSTMRLRAVRGLASVTQCGWLDVPKSPTHWRGEMTSLCASEDEINEVSTRRGGITKQ